MPSPPALARHLARALSRTHASRLSLTTSHAPFPPNTPPTCPSTHPNTPPTCPSTHPNTPPTCPSTHPISHAPFPPPPPAGQVSQGSAYILRIKGVRSEHGEASLGVRVRNEAVGDVIAEGCRRFWGGAAGWDDPDVVPGGRWGVGNGGVQGQGRLSLGGEGYGGGNGKEGGSEGDEHADADSIEIEWVAQECRAVARSSRTSSLSLSPSLPLERSLSPLPTLPLARAGARFTSTKAERAWQHLPQPRRCGSASLHPNGRAS